MKKLFCLLLIGAALLCGCASATFYEEETQMRAWLAPRTEGYTLLQASSRMVLRRDEKGISLQIDTGSDTSPRLKVSDGKAHASVAETELLTLTVNGVEHAKATHAMIHYDPYRNAYTPSMKVYQKDADHFRIFFFLYGGGTDFYPVPRLLTETQYKQMLEQVKAYTEQETKKSLEKEEDPVNYTGDFLNLYTGVYQTPKASNPDGKMIYVYNEEAASDHLDVYRTLFGTLNMSEQDWRRSFEKLGYTG